MSGYRFSEIGIEEAIERLYEGTPFKAHEDCSFTTEKGSETVCGSEMFLEGVDFDLVYFPLKHLGYKCVIAATTFLYSRMAWPRTLSISMGISSKLDYDHIKDIWEGIVTAAKEHGYEKVSLGLAPSKNGLSIGIGVCGERKAGDICKRPEPQSKDLLCVSGSLGAAYLGLRVLEKGKEDFEKTGKEPDLNNYKMIVGSYLKPELSPYVLKNLEESGITPSSGIVVKHGLADACMRISRSTGLGVKVYADRIPFEGNSFSLGKTLDIDPISAAMNGGNDYRLLFTVPIMQMEKLRHDFQTFDIIGHLAQSNVGCVLVTPEGVELPMKAQGWKNEE